MEQQIEVSLFYENPAIFFFLSYVKLLALGESEGGIRRETVFDVTHAREHQQLRSSLMKHLPLIWHRVLLRGFSYKSPTIC